MVLMSLVEHITSPAMGYSVYPHTNFIPGDDNYATNCDVFMNILQKNAAVMDNQYKDALPGSLNVVVLDVVKNGLRKYQLLEAPGEDFISLVDPNRPSPAYLQTLIDPDNLTNNPVYYVFLLDLHSVNTNYLNDPVARGYYEQRIIDIYQNLYNRRRGDKIILLYNKFDMRDRLDPNPLDTILSRYYPQIKARLQRSSMVLFRIPDYKILPYISGSYREEEDEEGEKVMKYRTTQVSIKCADALWKSLTNRW